MSADRVYSMTNDIIFKYIFGNEKNSKILISLLNALLGREGEDAIENVTLINPTNLQEFIEDKLTHLDVKAKDNAGKFYNIEVQVRLDYDFIPRIIFYNDRLFTEQLSKKESYSELAQTITLAIIDFMLFEEEPAIHNIYRYLNVQTHRELTRLKELHFVELRKYVEEKPRKDKTRFEKWLYALKFKNKDGGSKMLPQELLEDEEIGPAMMEFQKAIADPNIRALIEMREKAERDEISRLDYHYKKGRTEGIAEGKAKGKAEGKTEGKAEGIEKTLQVISLFGSGEYNVSDISAKTGLPLESVQKIINSINDK